MAGEERLFVAQTTIRFYVKMEENSNVFISREYKYTVQSDGRIQPFPMRSADAVLGVGKYDWHWDKSKIVKADPKTNELIIFEKLSE
jgi:hypothetical protein